MSRGSYGESVQYEAHAQGPRSQIIIPSAVHGIPATAGDGLTVNSNLIDTEGYPFWAIAMTSDHAGTLSVQRYVDPAGTIKQGAAVPAALVANTPGVVNLNDNNPFYCFKVSFINSSGAAANLSNVALLGQG